MLLVLLMFFIRAEKKYILIKDSSMYKEKNLGQIYLIRGKGYIVPQGEKLQGKIEKSNESSLYIQRKFTAKNFEISAKLPPLVRFLLKRFLKYFIEGELSLKNEVTITTYIRKAYSKRITLKIPKNKRYCHDCFYLSGIIYGQYIYQLDKKSLNAGMIKIGTRKIEIQTTGSLQDDDDVFSIKGIELKKNAYLKVLKKMKLETIEKNIQRTKDVPILAIYERINLGYKYYENQKTTNPFLTKHTFLDFIERKIKDDIWLNDGNGKKAQREIKKMQQRICTANLAFYKNRKPIKKISFIFYYRENFKYPRIPLTVLEKMQRKYDAKLFSNVMYNCFPEEYDAVKIHTDKENKNIDYQKTRLLVFLDKS